MAGLGAACFPFFVDNGRFYFGMIGPLCYNFWSSSSLIAYTAFDKGIAGTLKPEVRSRPAYKAES